MHYNSMASRERDEKRSQRGPKGSQMGAIGLPEGNEREPKGSKRGAKGEPKGSRWSQMEAKRVPK